MPRLMRLTNEIATQNETESSRLTNHVSIGLSGLLRRVRMPIIILPVAIPRQAYQPMATPITPRKTAGKIIGASPRGPSPDRRPLSASLDMFFDVGQSASNTP